jgi:adenylosuccinate lyase
MINRYSTKEMVAVWEEDAKFSRWVEIEATINEYLQRYGTIPQNNLSEELRSINLPDLIKASTELESKYKHDVLSFVFAAEQMCKDGRWIHYGLTSSDILDTATAMAINKSLGIIVYAAHDLRHALLNKMIECKEQEIIGRTHGQYAELVKLKDVFFLLHDELDRNINRLTKTIVPGKLSGAVGDNKYIPKEVEKRCLKKLGVDYTIANQIVSRDFYAELISNLALMSCWIDKVALQIRLYQQSGICEILEPFYAKQKGSSAMPHKRNPILCENLCGLSRIVRGNLMAAMENIALWQERDISHSSAERIILPDTFNLVHFMIKRMQEIILGLEINFNNIDGHIEEFKATGNQDSQQEMLDLIQKGHGRREAYEIIQKRGK